MKICIYIMILFLFTGLVSAMDMREDYVEIHKKQQKLLDKAEQEAQNAKKEAKIQHQKIVSDRASLLKAVSKLEQQHKIAKEDIDQLTQNLNKLKAKGKQLNEAFMKTDAANKELSGIIRESAKDITTILNQSPQSSQIRDRGKSLGSLINQTRFPSMYDIKGMVELLFEEIQKSGEVKRMRGCMVDRKGSEVQADILLIGNFSAMYSHADETGYLLYSEPGRQFFALSKLPKNRIIKKIRAYMKGNSQDVYLDISKGGALRQLSHELSLLNQVFKGGPIVWPIVGILIMAVFIILERLIYLWRNRLNVDRFTQNVCKEASMGNWEQCMHLCESQKKKSIPQVLLTAIKCRNMDRNDMENALHEEIINKIPKLEAFLSTLGMLAAIAPLLGLLGTVTGMINTFHVITYYGTGDPRMMSGGISEALVTTMLGLTVAIPIMLVHTLLTRKVETEIALMEEKAVALVNTVFKTKA